MKLPEQVTEFHEMALETASLILARGEQHDPLLFMEGGPRGKIILDLNPIFVDPPGKAIAAEAMRAIVESSGSDFAGYIIEAWTAVVEPGEDVGDADILTENRPGAQECLIIQAETREGGFWYWSHKITHDDAGTRVLDPEAEPWDGPGQYHRFNLFPRSEPWTN